MGYAYSGVQGQRHDEQGFRELRGVAEKSFYYWLRKFRGQIVDAATPQLVPLDSLSERKELLQISFRGAELKLPAGVDMDAVSVLLRSIQSL